MASRGSAYEIYISRRQCSRSGQVKDVRKDRMIEAMYPGLRFSKNRKKYWETRPNRSDQNKQARY